MHAAFPSLRDRRPLRLVGNPAASPHAQVPRPARERARRRVVQLVFALLLLAIVEGAIRKWVAPQWGAYIFFLRDPVLLLAYLIATRHALWPRRNAFFMLSVAMAAFGVLLVLIQLTTGGQSEHRLVLAVYGWRAYFLYAPLAFLVASTFRREDLLRLFKLLLWLALPIALLVAAQFAAPLNAPINVGIAEEHELQFQGLSATGERTRPMGPFASGAAQQQFVAAACAVLLAFLVAPRQIPQPSFAVLMITGAGVLTCIALSGSRGTVLQCALAVLMAVFVGLVGRGGALKGRAFFWPVAATVVAVMAYPVVFPEGHEALSERWQAADTVERRAFEQTGVLGRAGYGLVDFVGFIDQVPVLGLGLGFGGNAAITLRASVDGAPTVHAESDFARHMVDLGPVFGTGYIVFRFAFMAWLTALVWRATRRTPDPMPMLLWSYVAYVFVMGQLTGQGTINFFGWLFAGLLMASCSSSGPAPRLQAVAPQQRRTPVPHRTRTRT
jgi:hypothetical protein